MLWKQVLWWTQRRTSLQSLCECKHRKAPSPSSQYNCSKSPQCLVPFSCLTFVLVSDFSLLWQILERNKWRKDSFWLMVRDFSSVVSQLWSFWAMLRQYHVGEDIEEQSGSPWWSSSRQKGIRQGQVIAPPTAIILLHPTGCYHLKVYKPCTLGTTVETSLYYMCGRIS